MTVECILVSYLDTSKGFPHRWGKAETESHTGGVHSFVALTLRNDKDEKEVSERDHVVFIL